MNLVQQFKSMEFLELLANTVIFVVKILLLLFVFYIAWYFIAMLSGLITIQGEVFIAGGAGTLIFMPCYMILFYLPLGYFVKFLFFFPSVNPRRAQNRSRLVVLIFYLLIAGTSSPIIYEQLTAPTRSRESEAKQFIGSMNRAQQSYFQENKTFAPTVDALRLGIKTETENFQYSLMSTNQAAFHYAVSKDKKLKSYVGGVFVIDLQEEINTLSILCRTNKPSTIKPLPPTLERGQLTCGAETTEVTN